MLIKLVLVKDILKYRAEGWKMKDNKVVRNMGSVNGNEFASVYMVKEVADDA